MIIYTKGGEGASIITKEYIVNHEGFKVKVADTTGAGDSFIGAFLYQMLKNNISNIDKLDKDEAYKIIEFSNKVAAYVVGKKGTINIMPTIDEI